MSRDPRFHASSIEFDRHQRLLSIAWEDGHRSAFPFIWLRHENMFPLMGRPEQSDQADFLQPTDAQTLVILSASEAGDEIHIQWQDSTKPTRHNLEYLRNHCLSEKSRR